MEEREEEREDGRSNQTLLVGTLFERLGRRFACMIAILYETRWWT